MKTYLKLKFSEFGLFPLLNILPHRPVTRAWLAAGCKGIAPPIKHKVLTAYLQCYGLKQFIETCTYLDDTLSYIAQKKR